MNILIIGSGYVGLVTATCFAEMGNKVSCIDIDKNKIKKLNKGEIPIYEPNLKQYILRNTAKKQLLFSTNLNQALQNCDIAFIAVGTPMGEDGSADLQYVLKVAENIGIHMVRDLIVVNKSTVPVGTADKVKQAITKELNKRKVNYKINAVSNPEFLKEGSAINDFMKPDRVIIGTDDQNTLKTMKELYSPFTKNHERFISMDIRSAEMTKYAANAMLATKISFINEISNICERVGADVNQVRVGIGSDKRIGYSFIYPGCGYGGSCFPKDVKALERTAKDHGYHAKVLASVQKVNEEQKQILINKVIAEFGKKLHGKTFAVWGLSFKPETDDMRDAASTTIISGMTKLGAKIKAYDPQAIKESQKFYLKGNKLVEYVTDKYDALTNSDALLLITEWKEFRSPDFAEIKKKLNNPIIFDGRNQYNANYLHKIGFKYYQIGVGIDG